MSYTPPRIPKAAYMAMIAGIQRMVYPYCIVGMRPSKRSSIEHQTATNTNAMSVRISAPRRIHRPDLPLKTFTISISYRENS